MVSVHELEAMPFRGHKQIRINSNKYVVLLCSQFFYFASEWLAELSHNSCLVMFQDRTRNMYYHFFSEQDLKSVDCSMTCFTDWGIKPRGQ